MSYVQGLDLSQVPEGHRERLKGVLTKFDDMWDGHRGEMNIMSHKISLEPGAEPVTHRPYRAGPEARAFVADGVERMLKAKIIKPATSEWPSPVVTVPNHDGSYRMCTEY